jgi:molybdopterin converting factor small subunit
MAKIIIPTPLRKFTDNQSSFQATANNVGAALNELTETYPGIKGHLYDEQGQVRQFIKVFVGEDDIKSLDNENTAVETGTVISIVPAIAGGC